MDKPIKVLRQVDLMCPVCKVVEKNELIERYLDKNHQAVADEEVLCGSCGSAMIIQNSPPAHGKHSSWGSWNDHGVTG